MALLTAVAAGCGATGGDDALVFRFLRFDNTGITQADSVSETQANVDIDFEFCVSGGTITPEPYTVASINAVFRNQEAADLRLERMVIDVGPRSGRAPMTRDVAVDIPGGRCSNNIGQHCGTDADCAGGICTHSETLVSNLLLFDFDDKAHIVAGTYSVSIKFFASDPNDTYEANTSLVVRFDDFNNCKSTGGGAAS